VVGVEIEFDVHTSCDLLIMSSPDALEGESKVGNAIDERKKNGHSATENRGVPVTADLAILQQNLAKYDFCQISGTNQQNRNFQKSKSLHYSVFRKCIECSNLKETNESCFNMLENKLGQRSQSYLAKERMSDEKGLLRCFGKTLEHCANCGSLQIHSLFAENEEDSALRLNLGGFSPVLCHNVFKTCESKGDDIDCRLVILGARPRSSPAHAVLSEHTRPGPTFGQDYHYQSLDPQSNNQSDETRSLPHSYDQYPSFYEASEETFSSQRDQSKAGSSHNSKDVSLLLEKAVSCNDPVASTNHLIEGSSHLKRILPSPSSSLQSGTPPILCSFAKTAPYEHARETAGSTHKSPSVVVEDASCDVNKYATSSQLESNLPQMHSLAVEPNVVSPFKRDDTKTQKKRTVDVLDETEHPVPAKKHNCKVSSMRSLDEMNVRNAYGAKNSNSIVSNYCEPRESGPVVKTECEDTSMSMTTAEQAPKSPIRIQPYFAPTSLQGVKLTGEGASSAVIQADSADRESLSKNIDANASQVSSPTTYSERTEDGLGKCSDSQETGTLAGKADIDVAYPNPRREQKDPVSHWSNKDVISFLKGTDCGEYSDVFVQEDIDGQALLLLNEEKLHNLLGIKMGPAMKIAQHIRNLQVSQFSELETIS